MRPDQEYELNFSRPEILTSEEEEIFPTLGYEFKQLKPDIKEFSDIYPPSIVAEDIRAVKDIEKKHLEHTERSAFLEAALGTELVEFDWFGTDAVAVPTSDFDDYFRGVDLVYEFDQGEGKKPTRLGIDVTTGKDGSSARVKRDKNFKRIREGKLSSLKYFKSSFPEDQPYKGSLTMLPKVIVGTDHEGVKDLAKKIHGYIKSQDKNEKQNSKNELEKHYIQIELLEEVCGQLELFIEEARVAGYSDKDPIVKNQRDVLVILEDVMEEKKRSIEVPNGARNNPVYKALTEPITGSKAA
ncbi:MAG: hypothetical protein ACLFNN_02415 [Candidatus Paceibacterota bacterium]